MNVPNYFLLGEEPRDIEKKFIHLELLSDRSQPSDWHIRPHAHDALNHFFLIRSGAGEMHVDGHTHAFVGPALLLVPAQSIHAFDFVPDSDGIVTTIGEPFLQELLTRVPGLGRLFDKPVACAIDDVDGISSDLDKLNAELNWNMSFGTAAIEARLTAILIFAARMSALESSTTLYADIANAQLINEFRHLLEKQYREHWTVETYAKNLGVSAVKLRRACRKITNHPPYHIIQERLVLEAKRSLSYSNRTIAQIGFSLGFDDPAYFSRFIVQRLGETPRQYRQDRRKIT
ncbi:MAG: helix-turn-helix domain-containing protein [Robiginitomaculum sp.]|nr:helix-turn-helix domain-containing protein [Robiginitomaculum sp.]